MLVLSRRKSERILVGEDIRITIIRIDRHQVRLGIEAPTDVPILREEIVLDVEEVEESDADDSRLMAGAR